MIKQYETINTFSRAPGAAQVITYLIFIGEVLTFFLCIFINYESIDRKIAMLILYLATGLGQILITTKTSCNDPSDNIMIEYRNSKNRRNINIQDCLYCDICMSYVKQTSRHCKVCKRCVQDFDHHCMWINNCVGSKNYKDFMAMITVTLLNMLTYLISMILLWTQGRWNEYLGSMIVVWVLSVVIGVFCILLSNLIGLHIYLIYKGMTTYQFIMLQREQQRVKKEQSQKVRQLERRVDAPGNRQNTIVPVQNRQTNQNNQRNLDEERPPALRNQQFKNQSNHNSHQNSDVIFGAHINQNQNKTSKSQRMSEHNIDESRMRRQIDGNQNEPDEEQEPSPLNSKGDNKSSVSHFFTKNKSLKFFIGDQVGSRPKSTRNPKQISGNNLYKSLRVVDKQGNSNAAMHQSQVRGQNKNVSLQNNNNIKSFKTLSIEQDQNSKKNIL